MNRFNLCCYLAVFVASAGIETAAFAQKSYDPNLGHFFMGRQQITIEDNSPIINDKTGSTANGANGALLNRQVPLPKSGWQGYAPVETPGINPNLPKVPGPVRQSHTVGTAGASGQKGHTGKLTAKTKSSAVPISAYKPYTKYPEQTLNTQAAQDLGVSTHVKGNLLHWARRTPKQQ